MPILDYYKKKSNIKLNKNLGFFENVQLHPTASIFAVFDAYQAISNTKTSYDIWTSSGIIEDVDIKTVPLRLAELYKTIGNKHMYDRFINEYKKQ